MDACALIAAPGHKGMIRGWPDERLERARDEERQRRLRQIVKRAEDEEVDLNNGAK